jgi:hypothetical protein
MDVSGTGAGLRIVVTWQRRASSSAHRTVSSGVSSWHITTSAHAKSPRRLATVSTSSHRFAPGATAIWLRPAASTTISAVPVAAAPVDASPATSRPSPASAARMPRPGASSPRHAMRRTSAPSRRAARAWFAPLPPWLTSSVPPVTVSPGCGSRASATV